MSRGERARELGGRSLLLKVVDTLQLLASYRGGKVGRCGVLQMIRELSKQEGSVRWFSCKSNIILMLDYTDIVELPKNL